jgi:hypothetical protein
MKLRTLLVAALLGSAVFVGPTTVLAADACDGNAGVNVFEDINYGGGQAYGCGVGWYRSDFQTWHDGLGFFASWDNRMSSYKTFNFTGHAVRFYQNANKGGVYLTTTGTSNVSNLGNYNRNDMFSSGWIFQ